MGLSLVETQRRSSRQGRRIGRKGVNLESIGPAQTA
jgi:hypothetical protein